MLAFPLAIASYEFYLTATLLIRQRKISSVKQWRWLAPLVACLSIFGGIYLFQGLAPEAAIEIQNTPEVQKKLWAVTPGGGINFLAFVGLYLVIPEFILFQSWAKHELKEQRAKIIFIAVGLLVCFSIFPPLLQSHGIVEKLTDLLPHDILKLAFLYCLSLTACLRFSQLRLISFMILFNSLIMIKAYPWDKYILPLAIVFWYLKSISFEEVVNKKLIAIPIKLKLKLSKYRDIEP
jgi:hypothetical protein